jgi:hypothetical protein
VVEGSLNPRSQRKAPFNPSPTIRRTHKPLSYNVTSYRGKATTKQVKKLQKIDPRSQQMNASDYMFHTQFQQDLCETVIIDRRRIVSEAQWVDWHHMEEQCHTLVLRNETEAFIRVPRMFKSHVQQTIW